MFYYDLLAADWSPDGLLIALTDESGVVYILDHDSLDIIDKLTSSFADNKTLENPRITIVKFSPDNNMLAISGYNIYDIQILTVKRK